MTDAARLVADEVVGSTNHRPGFASSNHYREGRLVCEFNDNFVNGLENGFGIQKIPKSNLPGALTGPADQEHDPEYCGDWRDGRRNGYGKLRIVTSSCEHHYEGGWKDGRGCGFGKVEMATKSSITWWEGGFWKGHLHGWGTEHSSTSGSTTHTASERFTGGFKRDVPDGYRRKYIGPSCAEIVSLKDDQLHGFQTDINTGEKTFWSNGSRSAPPRETFDILLWFPGPIVLNACHARYQSPTTHSFDLQIDLVDNATYATYTGNVSYGKAHGYGVLKQRRPSPHGCPEGSYDGGWCKGLAAGFGIWKGRDGNQYEGGWLDGKPYGYGKVTLSSGDTFDIFRDDETYWRAYHYLPLPSPEHRRFGNVR